MALAEKPEWKHDGSGIHTLRAGFLTLECLFDGERFRVYVNGVLCTEQPTDIAAAKQLAVASARQIVNRTDQLLQAIEA